MGHTLLNQRYGSSTQLHVNFHKVKKLATVVEGDQKALFSIATTLRCRGVRYTFPWIAHFILDMYLILLIVKQGGIKYHF